MGCGWYTVTSSLTPLAHEFFSDSIARMHPNLWDHPKHYKNCPSDIIIDITGGWIADCQRRVRRASQQTRQKLFLKKSNHKIIAKKIYIVSAVIKPGCSLQLPGGPVVRSGNQAAGHGFARAGFAPVTVAPRPPDPPVLRRGGAAPAGWS